MDTDSQLKILTSNIEKLEKLIDDLNDNVDSKRKKIRFLENVLGSGSFQLRKSEKNIVQFRRKS